MKHSYQHCLKSSKMELEELMEKRGAWTGILGKFSRSSEGEEEPSTGPSEATWNIGIPPSKAVLEEQVRKEGPRRTGKPKWASWFFLPFNFLCPLLSEASLAAPSLPGLEHFKALPGWRELSPGKQC